MCGQQSQGALTMCSAGGDGLGRVLCRIAPTVATRGELQGRLGAGDWSVGGVSSMMLLDENRGTESVGERAGLDEDEDKWMTR